MFPRWWRLGIRPQLTIIVILGAVLSTVATLFIADNAIQNYVLSQARTQEQDNLKIANLVLQTQYGQNISISSPDNQMVADLPGTGKNFDLSGSNFGKYPLNNNTDYVDSVKQLIDNSVSIYQCANALGNFTGCGRIATTFTKGTGAAAPREVSSTNNPEYLLSNTIFKNMGLASATPHDWFGTDTVDGRDYYADFTPIYSPQHQVIGVLSVAVPQDTVNGVVSRTAVELVLIGTIIMVAGVVLALFFASTVVSTLQRAARQVSGASERIGSIAAQQSSGSAQQVWAINAINQALQNFSETAKDISHRTDQLALMGNQVLQRRTEISPTQIDSILAYITRSVRDISVASRQQASQYERMTGAMQAVIEIAEQVAGNSQQASESSERLELVVRQLQQLVGVRTLGRSTTNENVGIEATPENSPMQAAGITSSNNMQGAVRAIRPSRKAALGGAGSMNAGNGASIQNPMQPMQPMQQMNPMQPQMQQMQHPMGSMQPPMQRMQPAGNARSGMAGVGAGNGMNGMMPMGGPGWPGGRAMGMNEMRGPGQGAPDFMGGSDNQEWRLPPMPEMPPLPGLDGGAMRGAPSGPQQSRSGVPPYAQDGRGMSGPGGRPSMSGPGGDGWPRNQ